MTTPTFTASKTERIWLKPEDLAQRLGVSRSLIYKLVEQGKLPSSRFGTGERGSLRFHRDDIDAWEQGQRAASQS